jgi:hypothetical protein
MVAACSLSQPKTAGNATWDFFNALDVGHYKDAYSRVCSAARAKMTLREFESGGGLKFAPPQRLQTLVGKDADAKADLATAKPSVHTATVLTEGNTGHTTQEWRVALVKEHGAWKVCSFTLTAERPQSSGPATSTG